MPLIAKQQTHRTLPHFSVPHAWRHWILDRGSLTQRLIQASQGDFQVRVTAQGWLRPTLQESLTLKLPLRRHALVREVELLCKGEVWVVARSVIPASTLTGAEKALAQLGSRPLGAYLFQHRNMRRGPLKVSRLHRQLANQTVELWGRSSLFYLHNKPLMVSEYFLPHLQETPPAPLTTG